MLVILLSVWVLTLVQGQTPSPPFPAPSCSIQTKPGQCSLQMGSFCDCDQNNVRCSHDGECPGNFKCCSWGCGCRAMCAPPGVTEWPIDPPLSTKCELPVVSGPCEALIPRYYYNSSTRRCEQFSYGGCCGNANNFETLAACTNTCPSSSYN
eukprot:XP_011426176.1 PREDICTED: WAP four-disulfide core domain protein 6B [Crassostrea gigas]